MSRQGVEAVRALQSDVLTVVRSLSEDEWSRPSSCAGWRVQDVVAHIGSNFHVTVEPPDSPPPSGPAIPAEAAMELLVEPRKPWTAAQVLDEYEEYAPKVLVVLESLQEEPAASMPLTLADLGTYPLNLLAEAYAFDLYCHLRVDLLAPLGPIERAVPTADDLRLRPAIAWMLAGIPQMCGAALTSLDRPLRLVLDGPGGGSWTLERHGDGGVVEVREDGTQERVAATVRSTTHDFVIWGTQRRNWRDLASIDGDVDYAAKVLDQLNIV